MAKSITAAFLLMVLLIGHGGLVQIPAMQAGTGDGSTFPTVTFTRNLWNANPPYFSVAVTSMGSATYQSTPNSDQQTGAPYMLEFTVSSATQTEIFSLTQELNFFQGKVGKSQSGAASTGSESLSFADASTQNSITYKSSTNPLIRKLTRLFENISTTLEFGRRLDLLRSSNPSGLTAELQRMEGMAQHGPLVEFSVIAPAVQQIATDATVSEASRRCAQAILKDANSWGK
jgi:hypothetical protein